MIDLVKRRTVLKTLQWEMEQLLFQLPDATTLQLIATAAKLEALAHTILEMAREELRVSSPTTET